ncbi:hypothetical protein NMY22_g15240 [Coprinellus aureogranulatus]|nr:hypothetical protein NMY22_g15240 [Coprinellus aureogranulatus]
MLFQARSRPPGSGRPDLPRPYSFHLPSSIDEEESSNTPTEAPPRAGSLRFQLDGLGVKPSRPASASFSFPATYPHHTQDSFNSGSESNDWNRASTIHTGKNNRQLDELSKRPQLPLTLAPLYLISTTRRAEPRYSYTCPGTEEGVAPKQEFLRRQPQARSSCSPSTFCTFLAHSS